MSYLIGFAVLGSVTELKSANSSSSLRMARDKKSSAKLSSRNAAQNTGNNSPSIAARRLDEATVNSNRLDSQQTLSSTNGNNLVSGPQSSVVAISQLPYIPPPRELFVEFYLFIYLLLCLLLQNTNIYRQNWYLVDYDLILFSVIVLARTVLWRLLSMIGAAWSQALNYKMWIGKGVEVTGKIGTVVMLGHFGLELLFSYSLPCCLYLAYPVFLYTSLFGFTLDPHQERLRLHYSFSSPSGLRANDYSPLLQSHPSRADSSYQAGSSHESNSMDGLESLRLRRSCVDGGSPKAPSSADCGDVNTGNLKASTLASDSGGASPACSSAETESGMSSLKSSLLSRTLLSWRGLSPDSVAVGCYPQNPPTAVGNSLLLGSSPDFVRQEVECLWADYMVRIKQLLFSSVLCAYYAGFLPMQIMKHEHLYIQHFWCWTHTAFILCNSFLLLSMVLLPAQYCTTLYKSAMQLGLWEAQAHLTTAPHTFSPVSSWPRGSVVRHKKGIFRATGSPSIVAIPGDEGHESFYLLFTWALHIPMWCCMFSLLLLLLQTYSLWKFTDYLQTAGLFSTLCFSSYPYYHLARTTLILFKAALRS